MRQKWKFIGIMAIALIAVYGAVYAKEGGLMEDPSAEWGGIDEPFVVRDAISFNAMYGWLDSEADIDAFQFELTEPATDFHVSVDVPVCDEDFAVFYPSFAVIGNGLARPQDTGLAFAVHGAGLNVADNLALPFELEDEMNALVFTEGLHAERTFFIADPFGYYDSEPFLIDHLDPGTYFVAVWNSEEQVGPYVLRTGSTHPDFDHYTNEDWNTLNEMYRFINSGGWLGRDC